MSRRVYIVEFEVETKDRERDAALPSVADFDALIWETVGKSEIGRCGLGGVYVDAIEVIGTREG